MDNEDLINILQKLEKGEEESRADEIRAIYQKGMETAKKGRTLVLLGESLMNMARDLCKHPNKGKKYVCPDCGYDTGPDPY